MAKNTSSRQPQDQGTRTPGKAEGERDRAEPTDRTDEDVVNQSDEDDEEFEDTDEEDDDTLEEEE